jgi:bHLH factor
MLQAAAAITNDTIPSVHDAEAPPGEVGDSPSRGSTSGSPSKGRAEPGTVEWAQQRKDNHKEVERRRRGNINEGINELARILPYQQGDKAKGAVLQRAVQYVKQLKESEQKVMEKWTIEKLMLDREIAEWGMRYNECEAKWKEERAKREALEGEVARLKKTLGELEEDELEEDEDIEERPVKRPRLA